MVGRMKGLAKSKRVFTVDDDEYDDGTAAATHSGSESESNGHDDDDNDDVAMRPASSLRVRNSNFDDADPAYEGKVVRRTDLKSDDDDDEEDLEREMQDEWSEGEPFAGSDGDDQSGSDLEEEEEEDESEEDDEESSAVGGGGDVDDVIRALEEEDAAVLMRAKDIETQQHKAKHVHHQKMIWERCLELQIAIKQLIATINGVGVSGSDDESAKRSALAAQLRGCMTTMHAMQQEMYTLPEFSSSSKRSMDAADDMWQGCVDESAAALPQYQSILNKYARQADGVAAKKFKAVNQDVLVQVDAVLADPQRIRRKAHPARDVSSADDATDSEAIEDLQYDDREFYQQLLKEYIENGANGLDANLGASLKLKRKKKIVNRKASKGRVVKYTVMPKLQHFMFPDPTLRYKTNMDIDELFRSLFSSTAKA